jgi:hypothetical protein
MCERNQGNKVRWPRMYCAKSSAEKLTEIVRVRRQQVKVAADDMERSDLEPHYLAGIGVVAIKFGIEVKQFH